MDILNKIIAHKKQEVAERKSMFPVKLLEKSIFYETTPLSLKKYLLREDKAGIIAEIKRKSPSKGVINPYVSVERTSIGYMQSGASALSVLTDKEFFGGSNEDLTTARKFNFCPILRKDFIIDEYQIVEAKSIGADAILLIAAALAKDEVKRLGQKAHELGLEVLLEVHNEEELSAINDYVDVLGVNNRNLKTFETNIETSMQLSERIPDHLVKISESGISNPETILKLKSFGYRGFLIGEYFMMDSRPERKCEALIEKLESLQKEKSGV